MKQRGIRRGIFILAFAAVFLIFVSPPSRAAEKKPVAVKKSDKCAVCGMFVEKYGEWIAQIIFTDGTAAFFDGPKDMFRYYINVPRYNPSRKQSDIEIMYVTEYYSARMMDAKAVFFVQGSDVYGPMGMELIPVETEARAKEFMKDHKGKKLLRFGGVTSEDIR